MISVVDRPHVRLVGDRTGRYVIADELSDGSLVLTPDDSADAMLERHGIEPASVEDLEAEYGSVAPPDGEG